MKREYFINRNTGTAGPFGTLAEAEAQAKTIVERNGGTATVVLALVYFKAEVARGEVEGFAQFRNGEAAAAPKPPMIFLDPAPADPALGRRVIESSGL